MELNAQQLELYLQRISNILLINGSFLDNPGLYTGEMGLTLFFFRYARFSKNTLFSEYGFDLIGRLQNRINPEIPVWKRLCCNNSPYQLKSEMYNGLLAQFSKSGSYDKKCFQ